MQNKPQLPVETTSYPRSRSTVSHVFDVLCPEFDAVEFSTVQFFVVDRIIDCFSKSRL